MVLIGTEKFSIPLQATWHLAPDLSTVNYDPSRLVFTLKLSGIVPSIISLLGQMLICPNLKYIKLIHMIIILLTVDVDTLNK